MLEWFKLENYILNDKHKLEPLNLETDLLFAIISGFVYI